MSNHKHSNSPFRPGYSRVPPALGGHEDTIEQFLQAMSVDIGKSEMADSLDRMNATSQYANQYRIRLIDSGYVHQIGRGYVDFSLR